MSKKYIVSIFVLGLFSTLLYWAAPIHAAGGGLTLSINVEGYTPSSIVTLESDRHDIGSCGKSITIPVGPDGKGVHQCISGQGFGFGWPDGTDLGAPDGDGKTATWSKSNAIGSCDTPAPSSNSVCINISPDSNVSVIQLTASYTAGNATSTTSTSTIPADCGNNATTGKTVQCIDSNKIITNVINPAVKVFSVLIGVVSVVMLIIAGIIYSASQDDPKRVALAKKIILDVLIGIAVYVFLFAILNYLLPQGVRGG